MAIAREVAMACRLGVEVLIVAFNHFELLLSICSRWAVYNIAGGNCCWRP